MTDSATRSSDSVLLRRLATALRVLIALFLIVYAIGGLFLLQAKWSLYSSEGIVEPFWEPVAFLLMELCIALAGVLMLLGRRLVFAALAAHAVVAIWKCARAEDLQLGLGALTILMVISLVLAAFCYWQWRIGQLR